MNYNELLMHINNLISVNQFSNGIDLDVWSTFIKCIFTVKLIVIGVSIILKYF